MKIDVLKRFVTDPHSGTDGPYLTLAGRFDAFETELFRSTIEGLFEHGASTVFVDLASISFADSSALAELVRVHKRCRDLGGELVIVSPSDPVTVILELTRLDAAFRIESADTVAEVA